MPKSKFPLNMPFKSIRADSQMAEIALRLVIDFYTESPYIIGTATLLAGNLLVTAKHVLDKITNKLDATIKVNASLVAIQISPGPEYFVWDIIDGIACPNEDILLLRTSRSPCSSAQNPKSEWKQPRINPFPPSNGAIIAGFGYRKGKISSTYDVDNTLHINLQDDPIASVGIVNQVHEKQVDTFLKPFPCYQVNARFDPGMSGGPVFDENGNLCGIICSGIECSRIGEEPISYVSTLWPMFRIILPWKYKGCNQNKPLYPLLTLAQKKIVAVDNILKLEQYLADMAIHAEK